MAAIKVYPYETSIDLEDEFYKDAVIDLKHGITTYIYNPRILAKLKLIFEDLDIVKNDFYWTVRSNKKVKLKKGRQKKEVLYEQGS